VHPIAFPKSPGDALYRGLGLSCPGVKKTPFWKIPLSAVLNLSAILIFMKKTLFCDLKPIE
jgi:hypothetical protein